MDFGEQIEQEIKQHPDMNTSSSRDIKGGSVHTVVLRCVHMKTLRYSAATNMNLVLDLLLSCPDTIETENREIPLENAREGITLMTRDDLVEKGRGVLKEVAY